MNSGNLTEEIYGWMRSENLDKGAAVSVDAVIDALGTVRRPSRNTVLDELNAMVQEGVLTVFLGKHQLTAEGELALYPGTHQDLVEAVVTDLKNYMLRNDPDTVFKLQEYQSEMRQRLNRRQAAAKVVNDAIQALVYEDYWAPSGRDAYKLSE